MERKWDQKVYSEGTLIGVINRKKFIGEEKTIRGMCSLTLNMKTRKIIFTEAGWVIKHDNTI
jgi:hypothetical protein